MTARPTAPPAATPPSGDRPAVARPAVVPPDDLGVAPTAPVPVGTTVLLDADTRPLTGDVLFGGSPPRLLRLSHRGREALAELRSGPVRSGAGAALARRLTDAGLAYPAPRPAAGGLDLTVVVPVRDRTVDLDRCLACLGDDHPVVVVDDGSADPGAVAAVCAARGARLVRRPVTGGPGAARNRGLAEVTTGLVAFVDSDCRPPPGWLAGVAGHLDDPLVAGVAPRVTAAGPSLLGSALDLGDRPGRVQPMSRVAYLPTAAVVFRRRALGDGFDEALRYGEDVDLIWRLLAAGWRLRYEPAVTVPHREPASTAGLLRRRFRYGTSAGPLARRHPGKLAHLALAPGPAATLATLATLGPGPAVIPFAVSTAKLAARLAPLGVRWTSVVRPSAVGVWQTGLGLGRWTGQFALPVAVAVAIAPGRGPARRRLAVAALLLGPPLAAWWGRRPAPAGRFACAFLADQAAYGLGVYAGCWRARVFTPLVPTVVRPGGHREPAPTDTVD